jgi:hypothetical protein
VLSVQGVDALDEDVIMVVLEVAVEVELEGTGELDKLVELLYQELLLVVTPQLPVSVTVDVAYEVVAEVIVETEKLVLNAVTVKFWVAVAVIVW